MRYYDLQISDPQSGDVWKPTSSGDAFEKSAGGTTFTSYSNGQTDPGALNIEVDVPSIAFNQPQGAALVRVWGVGLPMIGQSADFNADPLTNRLGANVKLSVGMKKGLPLANPAQAGLILQGTVFQAFGNWQGVNQTLDLICYPPAAQEDQNIAWDWPAGTTLASALLKAFTQAFSQYNMVIAAKNITIANLTQPSDEKGGGYTRLSQLADHVLQISQMIGIPQFGESYSGVLITIVGNTIYASDSQHPSAPIQLEFVDLIGQPTWMDVATVSFKTVMRSDITVGSQIKFPTKGLAAPYVLTTQNAAFPNAPSRSKSIFQGPFTVIEAHHFGNFRQADADSWVTAFSAVASPTPS
jgi:hypothetical protein